jgi:hypothetical protein
LAKRSIQPPGLKARLRQPISLSPTWQYNHPCLHYERDNLLLAKHLGGIVPLLVDVY